MCDLRGSAGAFYEKGAFANTLAEVVEFRATDFATVCDLDLGDTWCVNREYALHAFSVGDFTNGECGVDAAAALGDDETCEDLDTLFTTFHNAAMDFDCVAYVKFCNVFLELLLLDFLDDVHGGGYGNLFYRQSLEGFRNARGEMASGLGAVLQG